MKPDSTLLDDIAKRLAASLPDSLQQAKSDLEHNFRAVLESALSRLDLVSREEFDTQAAVLRRTREKLEALSEEVDKLERERAGGGDNGNGATR